jgi:hypothetical protein
MADLDGLDEDMDKKEATGSEDSLPQATLGPANSSGADRMSANPATFWRNNFYGSKKSGRKRLGRIFDGTKVKVVNSDPDSEYVKVTIVGWVKKSELVTTESFKKQRVLSNRNCLN